MDFIRLNLPLHGFTRGLLKGFSSIKRPALLFTFEPSALAYQESLRKDYIYTLPVSAALMGMIKDYSKVLKYSYSNNYGYWINRATYLLQSAGVDEIEGPWNKNAQQASQAIRLANEKIEKLVNSNINNIH